jgi:hypothetical protein
MPSPSSPKHDHDEADYTYAFDFPGPEPSDTDTTLTAPSKRHQQLEACSEAAKRRVDAATANMENRCLITNSPPKQAQAVEYAHLLPRATTDSDASIRCPELSICSRRKCSSPN